MVEKINKNNFNHKLVSFPFEGKSKNINLKFNNKNVLSVFPVAPFSEDYVYSIANSYNYYSVPDCIKFLSDIVEVADKFDLNLIIKLKRNNPFLSKKYLKFLDKLKKEQIFMLKTPTRPKIYHIKILSCNISLIYINKFNWKIYEKTKHILQSN